MEETTFHGSLFLDETPPAWVGIVNWSVWNLDSKRSGDHYMRMIREVTI
jgi:hypothetical protein